jgi:hypothetical protein
MASADALGHFNWENVPRKAIFRRSCEAGISRAKPLPSYLETQYGQP